MCEEAHVEKLGKQRNEIALEVDMERVYEGELNSCFHAAKRAPLRQMVCLKINSAVLLS